MAVPLLIAIAAVLAWGTIYEARFGTAAVQRTVYQAWWFQTILAFLAVNLAVAASRRYPWKTHHAPFVLAHLGIILMLLGGIIGGRFGIEGQLIIPEGQAEKVMQLPRNVLSVHHHVSETTRVFDTDFETRAWVHEPNKTLVVPIGTRTLELTVDRYYPDAALREEILPDGADDHPAAQLRLAHDGQEDTFWLLSKDPERFGMGWAAAHVLFFSPETEAQMKQLLGQGESGTHPRGVVSVRLPNAGNHDIPVPATLGKPIAISGTPYAITFKDYFPDFTLGPEGPTSRSEEPNNPAVALLLSGPEGADAHLLFARHPDFAAMHGRTHLIPAEVVYTHGRTGGLPPNTIALLRRPDGQLLALFTDEQMQRTEPERVQAGWRGTHPSLGYGIEIVAYYPKARLIQHIEPRSNDVRSEAVHVIGRLDGLEAESWVWLRQAVELKFGDEVMVVEYRPGQRELPVTIKLSDFRKITYPGSSMAAGFESDVQLTDPQRGVILMRKISMNNPLKYRGYSFFQSSFVEGPTETTILSVRNDPGTPLVYAGFLIIIGGVVSLFVMRARAAKPKTPTRRKGTRP